MLPGKRIFTAAVKFRRSASHVNKEFWQQFQNYAPPSLRVIRTKFARTIYIYIREYGSTLYVGLAHAVSPTNTNFRLTFLLTRLQEALYEDLAV